MYLWRPFTKLTIGIIETAFANGHEAECWWYLNLRSITESSNFSKEILHKIYEQRFSKLCHKRTFNNRIEKMIEADYAKVLDNGSLQLIALDKIPTNEKHKIRKYVRTKFIQQKFSLRTILINNNLLKQQGMIKSHPVKYPKTVYYYKLNKGSDLTEYENPDKDVNLSCRKASEMIGRKSPTIGLSACKHFQKQKRLKLNPNAAKTVKPCGNKAVIEFHKGLMFEVMSNEYAPDRYLFVSKERRKSGDISDLERQSNRVLEVMYG